MSTMYLAYWAEPRGFTDVRACIYLASTLKPAGRQNRMSPLLENLRGLDTYIQSSKFQGLRAKVRILSFEACIAMARSLELRQLGTYHLLSTVFSTALNIASSSHALGSPWACLKACKQCYKGNTTVASSTHRHRQVTTRFWDAGEAHSEPSTVACTHAHLFRPRQATGSTFFITTRC